MTTIPDPEEPERSPSAVPEGLVAAHAPGLELDLQLDETLAAADDWHPDERFVLGWAREALAGATDGERGTVHGERAGSCLLAVRLVERETMRALNRDWRGRDAPTNVLSFPAELPALDPETFAGDERAARVPLRVLGDLALCPAVIAAEARAQGKRADDHWAHLIVHGVLHLLGHDHEDATEAEAMEALERRLLARRDLPDPYAAPSSGTADAF